MSLYCGIDSHSNNHVVVVIDEEHKRLYEKRLPNDLCATLKALEPFKNQLVSTVVESIHIPVGRVISLDVTPIFIDVVMENQSDLVEIVHTLKQVMCIKG